MNRRRLAAIATAVMLSVLVIGLFQTPALAQGCSMCRTALENSPEGKEMSTHFNRGILFMLTVPYLLFSAFGIVLYRAHRKKKAARRPDNPYIPRG
jgi:hypothetical protein